jgi:HK97 family phage major capsid protein
MKKELSLDDISENAKKKLKNDSEFVKSVIEKAKRDDELSSLSVSGQEKDFDPDEDFGLILKGVASGETNLRDLAKRSGVEKSVTKDTLETDFTNAGFAIPTPLHDEIIDILDAEPAFLDAGINRIDMTTGKLDVPRHDQDPTTQAQKEGESIPASDIGGDKKVLSTNKYTGRFNVSNDWLNRDKVINADYIMDRLVKRASNRIDQDMFVGSGGQNTIQGVKEQCKDSNVFASTGTTITDIISDMETAKNNLDGSDVPEERRAWFMRRDVRNNIMMKINSDEDTLLFRELFQNGTLFGAPVYTTNNIPSDSGDSDIFYCELSEVMVGVSDDMRLDESQHYKFDEDETSFRLVTNLDMVLQHEEAVSVIENYSL